MRIGIISYFQPAHVGHRYRFLYERVHFIPLPTLFLTLNYSSLSSLEWQPHPLWPKGTRHRTIDWSPWPQSLCPACAFWPPYHLLTVPTIASQLWGGLSLHWRESDPLTQLARLFSVRAIIWAGLGDMHHKTLTHTLFSTPQLHFPYLTTNNSPHDIRYPPKGELKSRLCV